MDTVPIDQVHDLDAPVCDEPDDDMHLSEAETVEHWSARLGRDRSYLHDVPCSTCDGERTSAITDAVACARCDGVGLEPTDPREGL